MVPGDTPAYPIANILLTTWSIFRRKPGPDVIGLDTGSPQNATNARKLARSSWSWSPAEAAPYHVVERLRHALLAGVRACLRDEPVQGLGREIIDIPVARAGIGRQQREVREFRLDLLGEYLFPVSLIWY